MRFDQRGYQPGGRADVAAATYAVSNQRHAGPALFHQAEEMSQDGSGYARLEFEQATLVLGGTRSFVEQRRLGGMEHLDRMSHAFLLACDMPGAAALH